MQRKIITLRSRSLRRELTPSERLLWKALRNRQLVQYKFRRQHPIGPYVVDFYCPQWRLIIEVDGDIHAIPQQMEYDQRRSKYLEKAGYRVVRFTNQDVQKNVVGMVEKLLEYFHHTSP